MDSPGGGGRFAIFIYDFWESCLAMTAFVGVLEAILIYAAASKAPLVSQCPIPMVQDYSSQVHYRVADHFSLISQ